MHANGANIQAKRNYAIRLASKTGHLPEADTVSTDVMDIIVATKA